MQLLIGKKLKKKFDERRLVFLKMTRLKRMIRKKNNFYIFDRPRRFKNYFKIRNEMSLLKKWKIKRKKKNI